MDFVSASAGSAAAAVAPAVGDFKDDDLAVADATFGSGEARDGACSRAAAPAALGVGLNSDTQSTAIESARCVSAECEHGGRQQFRNDQHTKDHRTIPFSRNTSK